MKLWQRTFFSVGAQGVSGAARDWHQLIMELRSDSCRAMRQGNDMFGVAGGQSVVEAALT